MMAQNIYDLVKQYVKPRFGKPFWIGRQYQQRVCVLAPSKTWALSLSAEGDNIYAVFLHGVPRKRMAANPLVFVDFRQMAIDLEKAANLPHRCLMRVPFMIWGVIAQLPWRKVMSARDARTAIKTFINNLKPLFEKLANQLVVDCPEWQVDPRRWAGTAVLDYVHFVQKSPYEADKVAWRSVLEKAGAVKAKGREIILRLKDGSELISTPEEFRMTRYPYGRTDPYMPYDVYKSKSPGSARRINRLLSQMSDEEIERLTSRQVLDLLKQKLKRVGLQWINIDPMR